MILLTILVLSKERLWDENNANSPALNPGWPTPKSRFSPSRGFGATATIGDGHPPGAASNSLSPARTSALGVALSLVTWLRGHLKNIQIRYAGALAPSWFPAVLDLAIQISLRRQTVDPAECVEPHSSHFAGETPLGHASRSWGNFDAGHRGLPSNSRQLHDSPAKTAICKGPL